MKYTKQEDVIDNLKYKVEEEGLEYSVINYSDWQEIKNEKFQALLSKYQNAFRELKGCIEEL